MNSAPSKLTACIGAFLIVLLCGCKDSTEMHLQEIRKQSLNQAKAKWLATNHEYYSFYYKLSCFCDTQSIAPKNVSVLNGAVLSATNLDTNYPVSNEARAQLYSVEGLFGLIQRAISENAKVIHVEYDTLLGYPTSIAIDYSEVIADEEVYIEVNNLVGKDKHFAMTDTIWQLKSFNTIAGPQLPLAESLITLWFSRQTLAGNAGCNNYFAGYNIQPASSTISVSNISSTEISCENALEHQESMYLDYLNAIAKFYFMENELILEIGADAQLQYERNDSVIAQ